MEVFYCNLNEFNEDIESFVIAKNKIESNLKITKQIDKKMSVNEFISYVSNFPNIYIYNSQSIITFNIYKLINGDNVIVFSSNNNTITNNFKEELNKINYNFDNLNKIDYLKIIENPLNSPYFSINNEIYVID